MARDNLSRNIGHGLRKSVRAIATHADVIAAEPDVRMLDRAGYRRLRANAAALVRALDKHEALVEILTDIGGERVIVDGDQMGAA